ncbi:alpha/beta hydrolase [Bradyrhizobium sp. WSM 1704]|uniref:alpha/beta fold hydrolase n=1 Tax=Bradyrhizobium semiaridum TaxID=2821404 RepID=UPI001CE30397|nr:alpha/beta hydrolase [Bradyrhizobium semiaridum]MCA6124402.1 alpha/beta hydrolase [Bradyrhizobium semiaridum]
MQRMAISRRAARFTIMSAIVVASTLGTAIAQTSHEHDETGSQAASFAPGGLPEGFRDQFDDRFAQVNGVRLHYVIGGPDDGPLVVLLHGWPQTWYTWRNVMPSLAKAGYRPLAVDYRGAGDSEKPAVGYDKATMAADIRALVHQLGASQVHLVGRDIGVMVAYAYAAQWPDEVQTLAMLDVPIPATRAWNEAKSKPDPELWHFGLFQQRDIAEMLVSGHEYQFIRDFYRKRAIRSVSDQDIAVYARAYAAPGGLRAGFELYRAFPEDETRFAEFQKHKLPMPVLALAGDKSNGMTEVQMASEIAINVRGGVAPDTGHWLPDENPEFLVIQLLAFLHAPSRTQGQSIR